MFLPSIFLDVGHYFYANKVRKAGARANDIEEEIYNLRVRDKVAEVWAARVALDNIIARMGEILPWLISVGAHRVCPYEFVGSDEETQMLCGTYAQRLVAATSGGIDAHIQMHLNAGGGKYSLVGYSIDHPDTREASEKMAMIFAEELNKAFDPKDDKSLISQVKVIGCSSYSDETLQKNIAYCLKEAKMPSVLLEPLFLDNPTHAAFLKTEDGFNSLVQVYIRSLDRIALEVFDV